MTVAAQRCRNHAALVSVGPGAYCVTAQAIWVMLPGIADPCRLNISDQAVRPCYTPDHDEDGEVVGVLDIIPAGVHLYRWRDGEIKRER